LEEACGARLHTSFMVPGGFSNDIPDSIFLKIYKMLPFIFTTICELDTLLTKNRI
jgi:NADH:ubiquinone oxidoreductase subunit D